MDGVSLSLTAFVTVMMCILVLICADDWLRQTTFKSLIRCVLPAWAVQILAAVVTYAISVQIGDPNPILAGIMCGWVLASAIAFDQAGRINNRRKLTC